MGQLRRKAGWLVNTWSVGRTSTLKPDPVQPGNPHRHNTQDFLALGHLSNQNSERTEKRFEIPVSSSRSGYTAVVRDPT